MNVLGFQLHGRRDEDREDADGQKISNKTSFPLFVHNVIIHVLHGRGYDHVPYYSSLVFFLKIAV